MKRRLIVTCCCLSLGITASGHADVKDDLQGIKKEIREKKLLLNETSKVESQVSTELGKLKKTCTTRRRTWLP